MEIIILVTTFFIFLFGIIIGSFLNALIYRLSLPGFSFWKSLGGGNRSYCPQCKHQLSWLDLIPLVSFFMLKGRCRYCQKNISWQYPIVEIATGLLFLGIFSLQLSIFNLIFFWYIVASLIVIFVFDLKYYLIPDQILFPAIGVTFFYRLCETLTNGSLIENWKLGIVNYVAAAAVACLFFLSIFLISRGRWMGFGDVKLAILLGLLLGLPNIFVGLFLSFFFGAIIGLELMLLHKKGIKSEIPFAPFLILGTWVALFFGQPIIDWYLRFFIWT